MEKMRPFQIGLLAVFVLIGIVSVIVLASFKGFGSNATKTYGEKVVIWGTLDNKIIGDTISEITKNDKDFSVVEYSQKDSATFKEELINAIADGNSPDGIILSSSDLVSYRSKLLAIPYKTISTRTIKDTYIDGAEIFALSDGLYAVPFAVDPLVMYWNRDIFASGGYVTPPNTWESLTEVVQHLTLRDISRQIEQSAVALGEYRNVKYAKEILLMLLTQSGSKLIQESADNYTVSLDTPVVEGSSRPLVSTMQFFIEFSNSNSNLYSWSRALSEDYSMFLSGNLAMYFGLGSEINRIQQSNPNLNFDVAPVPQGAGATVKRDYGEFYGFAMLKASGNPQGTYLAINKLASDSVVADMDKSLLLVPTSRALVAAGASDSYRQTVFNQALISRAWLDPDPIKSDGFFQEMIEGVSSNRLKVTEAVTDTIKRLELAF